MDSLVLVKTLETTAACSLDSTVSKRAAVHDARGGGATHEYMEHRNLDRLLWKGRWSQMSTLKHYIQLAVYHYTRVPQNALSEARLQFFAQHGRMLLQEK